jgi:acetoin:2,6-dichlorophenolindophenol oxidoreductase subunit beta
MAIKSFAQAMVDGLSYALASDPRVLVIGRGMTGHGPEMEAEKALHEKYADRIDDPPTSEGVVASVAIGAAMAGNPLFVHFGTAVFAFEACNQILNEAGNARFMSNDQVKVPAVFHMYHGIRGGGGAQHSQSPIAMYANVPGLQVVLPSSPADVQGLLRTALKSDNPTVMLNHTKLLGVKGEVPDGDFTIPFGKADVKRKGKDVTVVATSLTVQTALKAAELLAKDGIDAEIVDPRTVVPLDTSTICDSVRKTGRLVVVDEGVQTCSVASEVAACVAEQAFSALKAPIVRVARPHVPVCYAPPLEDYVTPTPEKIAAAVKKSLGK